MGSKYYDKILQAQAQDHGHSSLPHFDLDLLAPKTLKDRLFQRLFDWALKPGFRLARAFFPVVRLNGLYWLARHADVVAVLERPDMFGVPYGLEMRELAGGADFVLGVDGSAQQRQNQIIRRILLDEDLDKLGAWSARFSQSLIDGGAGRIDVVADLAVRVPTEVCRRYFGLEFSNPNLFADWSLSVSALLFADPTGDPLKRNLGLAGAARLRRVIDVAIARAATANSQRPFPEKTLVERLIDLAGNDPSLGLSLEEIRAILLGLVVGFIPTNSLAAANMIEALLKRPAALDAARRAARDKDRIKMRHILLEAGRLNPALSPGQWRIALDDVEVGEGTRYARTIPKGATVMAATMSAMRDRRIYARPEEFVADGSRDASLLFGHASHRCLGEHLSVRIITEMFLILFRQPGLRRARGRAGSMQRAGYFPRRLDLEYESPGASQTMIISSIPLEAGVDADKLEVRVRRFGNPAIGDIAITLDKTGIVHFASCSIVAGGDDENVPSHLLVELNVDGPRDVALRLIASSCGAWLGPIVAAAAPGDERPWEEILRDHSLDLSFNPWKTTGLNFFGTSELSVDTIDKQARLRTLVERILHAYLKQRGHPQAGLGQRAMLILSALRRAIRSDPRLAELDAFLVQPSRKELALARWRKPKSKWTPIAAVLKAGLGRTLAQILLPTWLVMGIVCHLALPLGDPLGVAGGLARFAILFFLSAALTLASWSAVIGIAYAIFMNTERKEKPDDQPPDHAKLQTILARENAPGYRQNHIIAVTKLKKGLVRRLALAFSLWGIRQSTHWFRPGFVVTMGTIHFAKWFRLPGSEKLIFQSNYDGSWESYLEDFVTRAHPGQTAAWSNGEGFPRSESLVGEGAKDGERFKRWVRRQQIPTAFWYSRFPTLTAHEMRANALVHSGLVRAHTDTAARSWLDLIGSAQRQPYELESPEIQSLIFRGLKRALFTACVPVKLPVSKEKRGEWLNIVLAQVSFGKFPHDNEALYVALSAAGLAKLSADGSAPGEPLDLLEGFSGAFAQGMARRGLILGDAPPDDPKEAWRWADAAGADGDERLVADALIIIYAPSRDRLEAKISEQIQALHQAGGQVVHQVIRTVTLDEKLDVVDKPNGAASYEHFGFRDGIATPIIRGTEKFTPRGDPVDVMEPGEFILGYRNNQGYFSPSIMVPAISDLGENLAVAAHSTPFGFADFEADEQFAARDFGRNGSFLAVRQLRQHVDEFWRFAKEQASQLNADYGASELEDVVGDRVTEEWVAAKMVGRWRDGRPLVGNPTNLNQFNDRIPDNDFSYGRDDPRGQGCPLGAHIRRANPRDSLEPDDPLEREIVKRHALLRRGRTFFFDKRKDEYPTRIPKGECEKGLMFIALCADLERQFEMMQQSWLGFRSFHGLRDENDPITARRRQTEGFDFTIPTGSGPLTLSGMEGFIDVQGGGYFFLPSRSALRYLVNFTQPIATQSVPMI